MELAGLGGYQKGTSGNRREMGEIDGKWLELAGLGENRRELAGLGRNWLESARNG